MSTFHEYLRTRLETGGFSTEDALGSFLPLVREVLEAHAAGRVAPLEGLDAFASMASGSGSRRLGGRSRVATRPRCAASKRPARWP